MDKDQFEGRAKQAGGALTDDDEMKREGEGQQAWGDAKEKVGDAKDEAADKVDDVKDKF